MEDLVSSKVILNIALRDLNSATLKLFFLIFLFMLISIVCTRYFLWPAIELWLLRTHLYGPSFACFTGLEYMELLLHVKGRHRWSIEAATWILIVLSISILKFCLVYWLGRMELPEWECVSSFYDCFSFCFNLHHRQACSILWVCHIF